MSVLSKTIVWDIIYSMEKGGKSSSMFHVMLCWLFHNAYFQKPVVLSGVLGKAKPELGQKSYLTLTKWGLRSIFLYLYMWEAVYILKRLSLYQCTLQSGKNVNGRLYSRNQWAATVINQCFCFLSSVCCEVNVLHFGCLKVYIYFRASLNEQYTSVEK